MMHTNEDWQERIEKTLIDNDYDVSYVNIKDFYLDLDEPGGVWNITIGFGTEDGKRFDGVEMTFFYDDESFIGIQF